MEEKLNNNTKTEKQKRKYRPRNNKVNKTNNEGEKTKKTTKKSKNKKQGEQFRFKKEKLKIIPLGGLLEIGKNITVFEYENDIILVDCGLAFPEDDMLGIDLVIPDLTYLEKNKEKIKGLVITHGHEDHIG